MTGEKGQVTGKTMVSTNNKNDAGSIDVRAYLERYYINTTNIPREYLTAIYYEVIAYTLGDLYSVIIPTTDTGIDKPIRTNLWIAFAGESGKGKSSAIDIISEIIGSVEVIGDIIEKILDKLINGEFKPSSENHKEIVKELEEIINKERKEIIENAEQRFLAMRLVLGSKEGVARHISEKYMETNGKFLVELDETRTLLQGKKGYIEELMDMLLTIYMGKPYRLTFSNREYLIKSPNYICLIGGAQLLEENFDIYLFTRGFYRRTLIIYGKMQNNSLIPSFNLEHLKDLVTFVIALAVKRVVTKKLWKRVQEEYVRLKKYRTINIDFTPLIRKQSDEPEYRNYMKVLEYIKKLRDEGEKEKNQKLRELLKANRVHVLRLWILNAIVESDPSLAEVIKKIREPIDKYVEDLIKKYGEELVNGKKYLEGQGQGGKVDPEDWVLSDLRNILRGNLGEEEINLLVKIAIKSKEIYDLSLKFDPIGWLPLSRNGFIRESAVVRAIEDMERIYQNEKIALEKIAASPDDREIIIDKIKEKIWELLIKHNTRTGMKLSEIYRYFDNKKRKYLKEALKRLWEEDKIVLLRAITKNNKPITMIYPLTDGDKDMLPKDSILSDGEVLKILSQ